MRITLRTVYKNIEIEVSDEVDTSADRAKVAGHLKYAMDNIDEKIDNFHALKPKEPKKEGSSKTFEELADAIEQVGSDEPAYIKPTPGQITYLRKLGATEEQIASCKHKNEASALITKLQGGQ